MSQYSFCTVKLKMNDMQCWSIHIFSLAILSGTTYSVSYILYIKTRKMCLVLRLKYFYLQRNGNRVGAERVLWLLRWVLLQGKWRTVSPVSEAKRKRQAHGETGCRPWWWWVDLPCCGCTPPHLLSSCCCLGGCFHHLLPSAWHFIYIHPIKFQLLSAPEMDFFFLSCNAIITIID